MLRRRHINATPNGRSKRLLLAAVDLVRWPFERFAWGIERRLAWPLRERLAGLGPSARLAGVTALVAVAVAAVAVGALLSGGHGRVENERLAMRAGLRTATPPEASPQDATGPALQGVPPSFGVGKAVGVAKQKSGSAAASPGDATETPAEGAGEGNPETGVPTGEADGAATASSAKPVPAGPAAMKVAGRFARAFVFYEIGKRPGRVKDVFTQTATPQLAKVLEERPPRLPERANVPKAKVVNLVPGPRRGKDYTVSVSLLRVGLTSELRITLQDDKAGGWKVSEILG